jgi:hypothetical protein
LTCRCLDSNPGHFSGFTIIFVSCGELHLLVSWCVGGRCDMTGSVEDRARSSRPSAEDWGWSRTGQVLGGRTIERSGDTVCGLRGQVTLCAVCTVHKETRSTCFLVWPQNQYRRFVSGLASKPLGRVSLFHLKTKVDGLSVVWPQTH